MLSRHPVSFAGAARRLPTWDPENRPVTMRAVPDIEVGVGTESERDERFRLIYAGNFEPVLAYALRRVDQPADAADVVAEIFLVAWRRLREIPAGDDARLWLYRVSRRVLANHYRGGARRERLAQRLRQRLTELAPDPGSSVPRQLAVRQAVAKLGS